MNTICTWCFTVCVLSAAACATLIAQSAWSHRSREGIASWYGEGYRGRTMANGQPFDPDALTCASWAYPLGTKLRITHGGNSVDVVVTDRGPAKHLGRLIDLSAASFARITPLHVGVIRVKVEVSAMVQEDSP